MPERTSPGDARPEPAVLTISLTIGPDALAGSRGNGLVERWAQVGSNPRVKKVVALFGREDSISKPPGYTPTAHSRHYRVPMFLRHASSAQAEAEHRPNV